MSNWLKAYPPDYGWPKYEEWNWKKKIRKEGSNSLCKTQFFFFFLLMNISSSSLMSYRSLAKNNLRYRKTVGAPFFGLTLYYREYLVFSYTVGDALKYIYKYNTKVLKKNYGLLFNSITNSTLSSIIHNLSLWQL